MTDYSDYETQRAILIEYLHVMIARCDWHGVADVAMDLRELEASCAPRRKQVMIETILAEVKQPTR
jgi:hypothetical protein